MMNATSTGHGDKKLRVRIGSRLEKKWQKEKERLLVLMGIRTISGRAGQMGKTRMLELEIVELGS